jgi:Repeat of unknown function (DUF5650)
VVISGNSGRGAVTWRNGSTGTSGFVSDANSLVGSGYVTPLSNGNYLVHNPYWNGNRGEVTWGNGNTGVSGIVSDANSLVGSYPDDRVGGTLTTVGFPAQLELVSNIFLFNNGTYLVGSPYWNGERGAVTSGNVNTGVTGVVSAANSLVGSNPLDTVGGLSATPYDPGPYLDAQFLSNGNYLVVSPYWNGRGAVTWVSGTSRQTLDGLGTITTQNSLVGNISSELSNARWRASHRRRH